MIQIKIADGTHPDCQYLSNCLDAELYEIYGDLIGNYQAYNSLKGVHIAILVYDEDEPIACGGIKPYDERTGEIKRVFVKKGMRNRGIATQIIEELEQQAKAQNYQTLVLETGCDQAPAVKLYQKLGYDFMDNYGQYAGDDKCICMKKTIGASPQTPIKGDHP